MRTDLPSKVGSLGGSLRIFAYDQESPLNLEEAGVEHRNGLSIHDISYAGLADGRIRAYLVEPAGNGPFAGIVFVHPGPGSRSDFLEEAEILARAGAICLLIDAAWANGPEFGKRASGPPEEVRDWFIQIAIDLRRALDLFVSLGNVDRDRIAFVGHSIGALFGGILCGEDNERIKASVLMAGVGSFTDVAVMNMPTLAGEELERYRRIMEPIDPVNYVKHASPCSLFFQFGLQDNLFAREKFLDYYRAASEPKSMQWYDADHFRLNEVGRSDRVEWLERQLSLEPAR